MVRRDDVTVQERERKERIDYLEKEARDMFDTFGGSPYFIERTDLDWIYVKRRDRSEKNGRSQTVISINPGSRDSVVEVSERNLEGQALELARRYEEIEGNNSWLLRTNYSKEASHSSSH